MTLGCPDCADADEETKAQAMSNKGGRSFLKKLNPFEEK
jgi:hypothetical protein